MKKKRAPNCPIGNGGGGCFFELALSEVEVCQRQGSNLRPMPYEDTALPLSYAGLGNERTDLHFTKLEAKRQRCALHGIMDLFSNLSVR